MPRFVFFGGGNIAKWEGKISLLSTNENSRQKITTPAVALVKLDGGPVTSNIGAKAMMVVSTPNVAGTATRWAPATMLCKL